MKIFYFGILIIILLGIFSIIYYAYYKRVYEILKKENETVSKNVNDFKDYITIYNTIKRNNNINKFERQILIQYFIAAILSVILFIVFIILVFTS